MSSEPSNTSGTPHLPVHVPPQLIFVPPADDGPDIRGLNEDAQNPNSGLVVVEFVMIKVGPMTPTSDRLGQGVGWKRLAFQALAYGLAGFLSPAVAAVGLIFKVIDADIGTKEIRQRQATLSLLSNCDNRLGNEAFLRRSQKKWLKLGAAALLGALAGTAGNLALNKSNLHALIINPFGQSAPAPATPAQP